MLTPAALYKHWYIADSVKQFITASVPHDVSLEMPENMLALAQMHSSFMRLSVWYALLYVVIEGYREIGKKDDAIDKLLSDEPLVDMLRRFRNAMFHYQADPFSQKLLDFLQAEKSTEWPRHINAEFKAFFERELPILETLERLKRNA